MGTILNATYFDTAGYLITSVQCTLPHSLDWKGIEEKEVFIRYIGGFPLGTVNCLIESQGERRLLRDVESSVGNQDHKVYRRKMENVEHYIEEECRRLGIDRTRKPRNQ